MIARTVLFLQTAESIYCDVAIPMKKTTSVGKCSEDRVKSSGFVKLNR